LVFYDEAGGIDHERQLAHLAFMAPYLKGLLVPGSTGDGWDMTDDQVITALESVIPFAVKHGLDLIVGILRPAPDSASALMEKVLHHLRNRAGTPSLGDAFAAARVRGLTITAPTSDQLKSKLREIDDLGKAGAILGWDQATYMPSRGAGARARERTSLSRLAHEKCGPPHRRGRRGHDGGGIDVAGLAG
jgi:Carboxypeptidase Taq (M32) metallopeptidase